jgi:hypothetical protein
MTYEDTLIEIFSFGINLFRTVLAPFFTGLTLIPPSLLDPAWLLTLPTAFYWFAAAGLLFPDYIVGLSVLYLASGVLNWVINIAKMIWDVLPLV